MAAAAPTTEASSRRHRPGRLPQYDADIIAAEAARPIQRAYDAEQKVKRIDLLALPELLVYLQGYEPSQHSPTWRMWSRGWRICSMIDAAPPAAAASCSHRRRSTPARWAARCARQQRTRSWIRLLSIDIDAMVAAASQSSQQPGQGHGAAPTRRAPPAAASSQGGASSAVDGREEVCGGGRRRWLPTRLPIRVTMRWWWWWA